MEILIKMTTPKWQLPQNNDDPKKEDHRKKEAIQKNEDDPKTEDDLNADTNTDGARVIMREVSLQKSFPYSGRMAKLYRVVSSARALQ